MENDGDRNHPNLLDSVFDDLALLAGRLEAQKALRRSYANRRNSRSGKRRHKKSSENLDVRFVDTTYLRNERKDEAEDG